MMELYRINGGIIEMKIKQQNEIKKFSIKKDRTLSPALFICIHSNF